MKLPTHTCKYRNNIFCLSKSFQETSKYSHVKILPLFTRPDVKMITMHLIDQWVMLPVMSNNRGRFHFAEEFYLKLFQHSLRIVICTMGTKGVVWPRPSIKADIKHVRLVNILRDLHVPCGRCRSMCQAFNMLTHIPLDKMAAIFLDETFYSLTDISLKFVRNGPTDSSPKFV